MNKIRVLDKLNLFLLAILPIAILIGSALINSLIILFDIFFLIKIIKEKQFNVFKDNIFYLLIIFWIYLIINSFLGIDHSNSLSRSFGFLRFIILAFGIKYYNLNFNELFLNKIIKIWCLIFFVVTIDLIFQSIFGYNLTGFISPDPSRLSSFLGDELKIGNYYFGFILISISYLYHTYKNQYLLYLTLAVFLIISLAIGERSNFLKICFIVFLFIIFFEKKNLKKKILYLFFILAGLSSIISLNENSKQRFWEMLIKPIVYEKNISVIYKHSPYGAHYDAALKIFYENKVTGVGLKNFRMISGDKRFENKEFQYTDSRFSTHPHQTHFEILAETGIIGYVLFLIIFYKSIKYSLIEYKNSKNLFQLSSSLFIIASLLPLLPSGSFFTTYGAAIFWINFGFLLFKKK